MSHYFDREVAVASSEETFDYHFGNEKFTFKTDRGVFSKGTVDHASYLLIKQVLKSDIGKDILDYGCGWGPVGIILKRLHPELAIDLVDVNERAVHLAQKNALLNHTAVDIYQSEDIRALNKAYDDIILNPPIRAGKVVIYDMYEKAHDVLNDHGHLYIVIKVKHGAKSHFARLKELFEDVVLLERVEGNWLIKATK